MKEKLKGYFILFWGFLAIAIGVAFSVKADLGISPLSCLPFILGEGTVLTMGQVTIFINAVLLAVQILLLRSKFDWIQLMQLPLSVAFGTLLDFAMKCIDSLQPSNYFMQWVFCLVGCAAVALGVYFEIKSEAILLPTEGIMVAIETVFNVEFGRIKVIFDVSFVIISLVVSYFLLGGIEGIGAGTIAAALLTGVFVKMYGTIIEWMMQTMPFKRNNLLGLSK